MKTVTNFNVTLLLYGTLLEVIHNLENEKDGVYTRRRGNSI